MNGGDWNSGRVLSTLNKDAIPAPQTRSAALQNILISGVVHTASRRALGPSELVQVWTEIPFLGGAGDTLSPIFISTCTNAKFVQEAERQ